MLFLLPTFSIVFAEEADSGREPRNEISSTLFRLRETNLSFLAQKFNQLVPGSFGGEGEKGSTVVARPTLTSGRSA